MSFFKRFQNIMLHSKLYHFLEHRYVFSLCSLNKIKADIMNPKVSWRFPCSWDFYDVVQLNVEQCGNASNFEPNIFYLLYFYIFLVTSYTYSAGQHQDHKSTTKIMEKILHHIHILLIVLLHICCYLLHIFCRPTPRITN